ncbi:chromosome segregation in meiosis-related protein [Recurvomyces mirabilis]|uniref:Chromosome segregation in meiosis protein n=1 Tax=Recurvomyces mirabilis TaxID=574656 RepID=A0AAE0WWY8_9PEZI|nr:chromosome segregation in meiosis-related protein [Recurvomyces mirabilis]KAK5158991.1 chromosome segregation in meiosis- protein [Recurvomyces mirabilis]
MPTAVSPNPRAADGATNYVQEVDDFLRDLPIDRNENENPTNIDLTTKDVDEEIKIRKPRKPVPKLDENLLLSDRGIIALRRQARRLKLKGKGHEFSDIGRLLGIYQLWLDDMFPKAKFRDGMKMVEKLGRGKRMNVMRKGWIDGTKTRVREGSMERIGDDRAGAGAGAAEDDRSFDDLFEDEQMLDRPLNGDSNDVPPDDELDALTNENVAPIITRPQPQSRPMFEDDEDELDEMLAHDKDHASVHAHRPTQRNSGLFQDDHGEPDEDELDALLAEEPLGQIGTRAVQDLTKAAPPGPEQSGEFDDEEEVLASMGW